MSVATRSHDGGLELPARPRGRRGVPARLLRLASDERLVELLRGGSEAAFEVIFDRHHRGVLGFCRHMLGSVEEAEDAVQHTFLAAYREIIGSDKPIQLRPWLYAIARNRSLTVLRTRGRQATGELQEPPTEHLAFEVERRHDLRALLGDVSRLPDDQRAALVLSELGGLPHDEIAAVLGCRREKVKGLVFQARSSLIASRTARETSCADIREQLATLTGGSLRRNELRRHLAECDGCRAFRAEVRAQRRDLALVLPVAPTVGLKAAVLGGGAVAAGTATVGGAAVATKVLVAAALVGGGTAAVEVERSRHDPPAPAAVPAQTSPPTVAHRSSQTPVRAPARPVAPVGQEKPTRGAQPTGRAKPGHAKPHDTARTVPPGHAKKPTHLAPGVKAVPPGQAKKEAKSVAPGQAKKEAEPVAPGQAKKEAKSVAPGQAKKPAEPKVAPGQAKKPAEAKVPPGQAKKEAGSEPPGQAKKPPEAKLPPGQAEPKAPPGQAKKPVGSTTPPGQAKPAPGQAKKAPTTEAASRPPAAAG